MRTFFSYKESPQQTELINSASQLPPLKMIPPTAQEHLGMFSANVITASVSGQLFKEPLPLLSHFNTWWCHGPLWGRRNSSNQLPLMTFSFTFFPLPFAQFFLPLFFLRFITEVPFMGWSSSPPPIGSLCFWSHFMRNACPCLNVLILLIDVPVFCSPGRLKFKKFQNMKKKAWVYGIVLTVPPPNIFDCRHIAVGENRAMLLREFHPFYGHFQRQRGM